MFQESLIARGLRFHWIAAAVTFCVLAAAVQLSRDALLARMPLAWNRAVGTALHPILPRSLQIQARALSPRAEPFEGAPAGNSGALAGRDTPASADLAGDANGGSRPVPAPAAAPLLTDITPANTTAALRRPPATPALASLMARRRDLHAQIEDQRVVLNGIPEQAEPVPQPVVVTPPPAPAAAPQQRNLTPQELVVRRQIAEQTTRLEVLRSKDTEIHPDVIEAKEKLAQLRQNLIEVTRTAERAYRPPPSQPAVVPAPIVREPAQDSAQLRSIVMDKLTELIRQQSSIDRQIVRLTLEHDLAQLAQATATQLAQATATQPARSNQPSAASAAATKTSQQAAQRPTQQPDQQPRPSSPGSVFYLTARAVELLFSGIGFALALAAAVALAAILEARGDHVAGADALQAGLPYGVTFVGSVPEMRDE